MAVQEPYMVKTKLGASDLTLKADAGEAFMVKDIQIYNPASNYITINIDKVTVGYFRVGGPLGSHLPFLRKQAKHAHDFSLAASSAPTAAEMAPIENAGGVAQIVGLICDGSVATATYKRAMDLETISSPNMTILGLLAALGIFTGYPVAPGQQLKITGAGGTDAIQLIIYEKLDPGDITPDMDNGTAAKKYQFINYGHSGAAINLSGDTILNTPASPAQFPDFPFGKVVDSKKQVTIHGILASDFAPKENDDTDYCFTTYLKLIQGRKTLFDEDMNGLLLYAPFTEAYGDIDMVGEGQSIIGGHSDVDLATPLIFPVALVYGPGEELNVYLSTEKGAAGQDIDTAEQEVAFIETVELLT